MSNQKVDVIVDVLVVSPAAVFAPTPKSSNVEVPNDAPSMAPPCTKAKEYGLANDQTGKRLMLTLLATPSMLQEDKRNEG
jgi:hypothetical protein